MEVPRCPARRPLFPGFTETRNCPYSKPCALELLFRQYISVFQNCLVSLYEGSRGPLLFVKEKYLSVFLPTILGKLI